MTKPIDTLIAEEQLVRQATDALIDKLGIMEATRFLGIKHQNRLESVERHRLWQSQLDKESFFEEIFADRNGK
jgi:hypothetical protein